MAKNQTHEEILRQLQREGGAKVQDQVAEALAQSQEALAETQDQKRKAITKKDIKDAFGDMYDSKATSRGREFNQNYNDKFDARQREIDDAYKAKENERQSNLKVMLARAFTEMYDAREQQRQATNVTADKEEKDNSLYRKDTTDLKLHISNLNTLMKENTALTRETVTLQTRSINLLSDIAHNIRSGGSNLGSNIKSAAVGGLVGGVVGATVPGMIGGNATPPPPPSGQTPGGSAVTPGSKKKSNNSLVIELDELMFIANRLKFEVDTLTVTQGVAEATGVTSTNEPEAATTTPPVTTSATSTPTSTPGVTPGVTPSVPRPTTPSQVPSITTAEATPQSRDIFERYNQTEAPSDLARADRTMRSEQTETARQPSATPPRREPSQATPSSTKVTPSRIPNGDYNQNAAYMINAVMQDYGMTREQAIGVVAHFSHESGLNPGINEIKPIVPGSRGGYGIAQWTGPRRRALEKFAKDNNLPVDNIATQRQFLKEEISKDPFLQKIVAKVKKTGTSKEAADAFLPFETGNDQRAIVNMKSRYAQINKLNKVDTDQTGGDTQLAGESPAERREAKAPPRRSGFGGTAEAKEAPARAERKPEPTKVETPAPKAESKPKPKPASKPAEKVQSKPSTDAAALWEKYNQTGNVSDFNAASDAALKAKEPATADKVKPVPKAKEKPPLVIHGPGSTSNDSSFLDDDNNGIESKKYADQSSMPKTQNPKGSTLQGDKVMAKYYPYLIPKNDSGLTTLDTEIRSA